jgi:hypothetical protein
MCPTSDYPPAPYTGVAVCTGPSLEISIISQKCFRLLCRSLRNVCVTLTLP